MHAVMGTGRLIAGRYRLQGPLGRGAMGIVWRGRDELLHRDVAVKEVQIPPLAPAAAAETVYQRTLREARTAARLTHPGVVTIFDVVEEDGSPWIVMELIAGRSLDQVIAEDGPLPPRRAATIGTSLLGALAAAHAAGVLHRDVKPGNVLVTNEGRAVLTDFGIATFTGDPSLTQAGMVVGTPGFTAPERVRGESATPASDLWSLGATLYAAVEGRGPFDRAGGATAITAGVVTEEAPRAASAGPLGPAIDALLRQDPVTRPDATAARTLLTDAGAAAGPAGPAGRQPGSGGLAAFGPGAAAGATGAGPAAAWLTEAGPAEAWLAGPPGRPDGLPASLGPAAAGDGAAGPAAGSGQRRTRQRQPWSRHWRMAAVATSVAAIVVVAVLGSEIYSRTLSGSPVSSQAGPAAAGVSGSAAGGVASPAAGTGTAPGTAGPAGASTGPDGAASLPAAVRSPAAGRTGASSTSAGTTGPGTAPPAGFQWRTVTAARVAATAGFVLAIPDGWQQRISGQTAVFAAPGGTASIAVSMSPFTYQQPGREAHYRQAQAIAADQYPGYRPGGIRAATFQGAPAAAWRYSWKPGGGTRTSALSLLVTLPTSAGSQSYVLTVAAPAASFAAARTAFGQALVTFAPLPPA